MRAEIFEIAEKVRAPGVAFAAIGDFRLEPTGSSDADRVLSDASISLYALDLVNRRAVFVEGRAPEDIASAPFLYLAQYESAQRIWTLTFDDFIGLAERLPDPRELIFIHSTGRAGSTLVSQLFAHSPNTLSLAEPDALCDLVLARHYRPDNSAFQQRLFAASIRMLCKSAPHKAVAIKGRSFAMDLCDWMHAHYPRARHLFVYRSLFGWIDSTLRAFPSNHTDSNRAAAEARQLLTPLVSLLRRYSESDNLSLSALHAIMWTSMMMNYLKLHHAGAAAIALNYEDLVRSPRAIASRLMQSLGIEPMPLEVLDSLLARDSQANSPLARDKLSTRRTELSNRDLQDIQEQLNRYPDIASADFEPPGRLTGQG